MERQTNILVNTIAYEDMNPEMYAIASITCDLENNNHLQDIGYKAILASIVVNEA